MARTSLVPQQPVFLSEADSKQLAEMDRQREAFNAAVEKYNQSMMGPGGYNEQLNAYIARLKEIEASGEEVPLPTAPTKMDVPTAPFTEESFVQAQEAAQARAQEAAGQRALAIQAFEDPSRFNLAGFAGLGSRTFAKGGEVKEGGTKASRMMKELGLSKPPKEKTLADEPSKQTPESLAYSLRAQAEGNRSRDLRKESFSAPGALNVKRFEAGGEARSERDGFLPVAGSMGMPGAPEHERVRADTLGFIKRMDDASVMATASRMTGMPFDTPTQARVMLEQLLGGGVSVSAGVMGIGQGVPERVVGYDVGAKFPALGGQMSVGATVPRGAGKPSFNVGYRKEFKDGGDVSSEASESRSYLDELEAKDDPIRSGRPLSRKGRAKGTQESNEAMSQAVLQGMANMPYNIAGIPGDLANLLAAPTGKQPFYGSESAKALATQLGIRPAPPTDPAAAALYGAADIGSSLVNPAAPVRAAARGAERAGAALSGAAKDFQQYNRMLDVPGASYAVKPKGGQWLSGSPKESLVEAFGSYDLMARGFPRGTGNRPLEEVQTEMRQTYPPEVLARMSEETRRHVGRSMSELENRIAVKRWIDGNLTNYIKNDLGTPDDPLRKLGEQGITHLPKSNIESGLSLSDYVVDTRKAEGFPEAGFSPGRDESRAWENLADEAIFVSKPSELRARARQLNPWVEKLQDPNTPLYTLGSQGFRQLGFDHVVDVLAEDLAAGRLRPNQLNKMSVEQAVRRTHEYDEAMRIAMEKAQAAKREEFPVYKTYPETNYRWIKLDKPGSFALESDAMGHSVRGYEPPKGHPDWVPESGESGRESYGHGGWDAIKSGRAQVYSLVDAKGLPHATIEMRAPRKDLGEQAPVITQVKGKQNSAPKDEYLPYVQDFVRSGEYPIVGDFGHTGFRFEAMEIFDAGQIARLQASNVKVPRYMTGEDAQQLSDTLYRIDTGNDPTTGMPINFVKGGPVNKHDAFIKARA